MSDDALPTTPGSIAWADLTVPDADRLRDFYRDVAGWTPSALSMGDYADFVMHDASAPPGRRPVVRSRDGGASV